MPDPYYKLIFGSWSAHDNQRVVHEFHDVPSRVVSKSKSLFQRYSARAEPYKSCVVLNMCLNVYLFAYKFIANAECHQGRENILMPQSKNAYDMLFKKALHLFT